MLVSQACKGAHTLANLPIMQGSVGMTTVQNPTLMNGRRSLMALPRMPPDSSLKERLACRMQPSVKQWSNARVKLALTQMVAQRCVWHALRVC